jgi:hypothetical protein
LSDNSGAINVRVQVWDEGVIGIVRATMNANVRAAPLPNAAVIDRAAPNTYVRLTGVSSDGSWLRVMNTGGGVGWISSTLIEIEIGELNTLPTIMNN